MNGKLTLWLDVKSLKKKHELKPFDFKQFGRKDLGEENKTESQ